MLNFIKNFFPYRAKSVEEFVEFVKGEGCKAVTAKPYEDFKLYTGTVSVCLTGYFQYILELTAKTPQGRKVVYRDLLFERFGSYGGFADGGNRKDAANKLFQLAAQKVRDLREELSGVSVDIFWPSS